MEKLTQWAAGVLPTAGERLISVALILVIGLVLIRLVMTLVKRGLALSHLERAAHKLILSIIQVTLYVLLGLSAASAAGIDVTGIVALASVLTLALSLSLQNILTNVISGLTLLSIHPFHSGDFVQIGDQSGTVQEINMTYTKLLTRDNKLISIPNSTVVTAQITNYSELGSLRGEVKVSASYDDDPQKVLDALLQAGTMDPVLLEPAPSAAITGFLESDIGYSLWVWVKTEDYWGMQYQLHKRIHHIFQEQGITMTYPHLNVHLDHLNNP